MKIRPYSPDEDFEEVCRWSALEFYGKKPASSQFSDTSFIAEKDEKMAGVLSVMLTNAKHYCILECLFTNPDLPIRTRREAIRTLSSYAESFAKALDYKGLFCWTEKQNMARHYKDLGYNVTLDSAFTLYKSI